MSSSIAASGRAAVPGVRVAVLGFGSHIALSIAVLLAAWVLILVDESHVFGSQQIYFLLGLLIVIYSIVQTYGVYAHGDPRIFINPTVHLSMFGNVLLLIFSAMYYFFIEGSSIYIDYWNNYYLWLLLVGNVGLWSGYRSGIARATAVRMRNSRLLKQIMRTRFRIQFESIVVLLAISLTCRLALIYLGVFGYSADEAALTNTIAYRQFLTIGAEVGKVALIAVALQNYSTSSVSWAGPWLVGILIYESFSGLISGFKSAVVIPFLIVAVCYYFMKQKIPIKWVAVAFGALAVAYILIEPFRAFRSETEDFKSRDVEYIITSIFSQNQTTEGPDEAGGWEASINHFISTRNPIPTYSRGLAYANENPVLPPGSPDFLNDILVSPLLAVVPRAVWSSKPLMFYGDWYYSAVLGGNEGENSVAMSATTFLYFAGGILAVFLGYFLFGIYQSVMFHGLLFFGASGALVYFCMFSVLAGLDNGYFTYIISTIRFLPALLIAQYLIYVPER